MISKWMVWLVIAVIVGFIILEENPWNILGTLKTGGS
jgi:hypothetical protein